MLRFVLVNGLKASCLIAGAACLVNAAPVRAADSTISVQLCSQTDSSAKLTITSPQTGVVVNQAPISISGEVHNVTQIQVEVDGVMNSTIAVGADQTTFQSDIQLMKGTHTISLTGIDVCHITNPHAELVVTYEPMASSDGGGPSATTVETKPPMIGIGGTVVTNRPAHFNWQHIAVVGPIIGLLDFVARELDFKTTSQSGSLGHMILRFGLLTIGLVGTIFAEYVARHASYRSGKREILRYLSPKWIRLGGLGLIALVFLV